MGDRKKSESAQLNFFATVTEKQCRKCNDVKPASHFGIRRKSPDGLRDWCHQCGNEYQKRYYRSNLEENRKRKREWMANARKNPEKRIAIRAVEKARSKARRQEYNQWQRENRQKRFFWARAHKLKGISARDLASLWKRQRGLCAYTGRKLDRSAQLDHIIPKALGGTDELNNLQWVSPEVNYAKRDLTHEQFIELCEAVLAWIARRIEEALEAGKRMVL
jgi:5-methylcytosine-specific restriction endonuclease McrA